MVILFYDIEVFAHDWLVVINDVTNHAEHVIINDTDKLLQIYHEHKDDIWCGFSSRHYDQYVLKAILCDFNPKEISDFIIVAEQPGWKFSSLLRKFPFINYDVMLNNDKGLKAFEGFMGHNIKETSVPFDIDRKLTEAELEETVKYCRYDVEQTIEIFLQRLEEFNASRELIKLFKLPVSSFSKTKAQLVCEICGGMGKRFDDNEFDFPIVPSLKLNKYQYVLDWYKNPKNHNYESSMNTIVAGVQHNFGWGGIHGARPKSSESGILLNMDVTAYYPSIQIANKFGYRNMSKPENFELIHNENLRYKAEGNKKARLPFKIADNSMSGQLKDKNSKLYDPLMNNAVCVNGQLMLLMLIEMVEPHAQLVQSNTDGILLKLKSMDDYDKIDDIVYEWECLTGMKMEFELFDKVYQKDVNNYILIGKKVKSVGGYVKALSNLDYDLPIINKALNDYMIKGITVEDTILPCNDLKEFQMVSKITSKYSHILHGQTALKEKCIRIFASNRKNDAGVYKVSIRTGKPEKISGSPATCFIDNDDVNGKQTPAHLGKQWYIDTAIKRLTDFGVTQYDSIQRFY